MNLGLNRFKTRSFPWPVCPDGETLELKEVGLSFVSDCNCDQILSELLLWGAAAEVQHDITAFYLIISWTNNNKTRQAEFHETWRRMELLAKEQTIKFNVDQQKLY